MKASNLIFAIFLVGLIVVSGCNWNIPPLGECGDGTLDIGEECDDGDVVDNDGCTGCVIDVPPECVVDGDCDSGYICVDNVCEEEVINPTGLFVLNGDFESADMSTVREISEDWYSSLGRTLERNTQNPISGSADYLVDVTSGFTGADRRPAFTMDLSESTVAGTTYTISFKAKRLSGAPLFRGFSFGGDTPVWVEEPITTGINTYTFQVQSLQSWGELNFHFRGVNANSLQIDDIAIDGVGPAEPTCEDGIQNGDETGVDCGGSELGCPACPVENQPPTVEITSPQDFDYFNPGETVTITANASDTDGTISKVEFYEGNNYLGQDTTHPYIFDWSTTTNNTHTLFAKAYDNSSMNTTSNPISIIVGTVTGTNGFVCENLELQCGGPCDGCPPPDGATVYYIANEGDDTNDGTDKELPWKSTEKLYDALSTGQIQPGDYVLFKRGQTFEPAYYYYTLTYPDGSQAREYRIGTPSTFYPRRGIIDVPEGIRGDENNWLTIGAYGEGDKPIIQLPEINEPNIVYFPNIATIRISKSSNIKIQDLGGIESVILRPLVPMPERGLENIKLLRLDFREFSDGIHCEQEYEFRWPNPTILKAFNDFEIGWSFFNRTRSEDSIGCYGDNFYFHHNEFYGSEEEAIDIPYGENHRVEYNYVTMTSTNGIKIHSQAGKVKNLTVRGNVLTDIYSHALTIQLIDGAIVDHNTIISNHALHIGVGPGLWRISQYYEDSGDYKVSNNIMLGRMLFIQMKDVEMTYIYSDDEIYYRHWIEPDRLDVSQFDNNIHGGNFRILDYTGVYNYNFATKSDILRDIHVEETYRTGITGFNMFASHPNVNNLIYVNSGDNLGVVDYSRYFDSGLRFFTYTNSSGAVIPGMWVLDNPFEYKGDFHLTSSSPAIDEGILVADYNYDFDGNPIQGTPDIGAYEYQGN